MIEGPPISETKRSLRCSTSSYLLSSAEALLQHLWEDGRYSIMPLFLIDSLLSMVYIRAKSRASLWKVPH